MFGDPQPTIVDVTDSVVAMLQQRARMNERERSVSWPALLVTPEGVAAVVNATVEQAADGRLYDLRATGLDGSVLPADAVFPYRSKDQP